MREIKLNIFSIVTIAIIVYSNSLFAKIYDFTEGNKLNLIETQKLSSETKINLIRTAKHHIHIISYLWDKSDFSIEIAKELASAHERGVEIRFMSTSVADLSSDINQKAESILLDSKDKNAARLSFLTLRPGQHESLTNNLHEKIFLVDGHVAILGGRNISDLESHSKDMEVLIAGPVVNQIQSHFLKMFNFLTDLKISKSCPKHLNERGLSCRKRYREMAFDEEDLDYFPVQPVYENGTTARILTNQALIQQHDNNYKGNDRFYIPDDIIDSVVKVNFKVLRAYNYFIIPTQRYKDFLLKNLNLGKTIDIITNSKASASFISDKGYLFALPEMRSLVEAGAQVYQWQSHSSDSLDLSYLHEKVMIFDDNHIFLGSHNYGSGSTAASSEIVIEFFSTDIAKQLIYTFEKEKSNKDLTSLTNLNLLDDEINANQTMIKILRWPGIRNLMKELY